MSVLDLIIPVEWSSENESMKQLRRNKVILMLKHSKADCLFVLESLFLAKLLAHKIKQGVSHFLFFFLSCVLGKQNSPREEKCPRAKIHSLRRSFYLIFMLSRTGTALQKRHGEKCWHKQCSTSSSWTGMTCF